MATALRNPRTETEWRNRVAHVFPNLQGPVTLANLTMEHSASKMTVEDFLPLKVLWRRSEAGKFNLLDYVDQGSKTKAMQTMRETAPSDFCKRMGGQSVPGEREKYLDDNIFSMVLVYMDLITRIDVGAPASASVVMSPQKGQRVLRSATARARDGSPTAGKGGGAAVVDANEDDGADEDEDDENEDENDNGEAGESSASSSIGPDGGSPGNPKFIPPTNDEVTVNMAFVLLAGALMERKHAYARGFGYRWIPDRDVYKIRKTTATMRSKKLLEARTDGGFHHMRLGVTASPLEVKPHVRLTHLDELQWQEGAQMAAHIQELMFKYDSRQIDARSRFGLLENDPARPRLKRRVHWGMNHGEIYINIFEYDDEYERYIRGPPAPRINLPSPSSSHQAALPPSVASSAASAADDASDTSAAQEDTAPSTAGSGYAPGFLVVKSYGPWRTRAYNDIVSICKNIFAISHYLSHKGDLPATVLPRR
ncbi:hypothetical protein B0H63DRAFT_471367 [Podospora didyma]|uniref:Uncharacterized protein n=1 Tax=Podospora didyma TaxID=330526 RepID=A0AAE0NUY9_9PEZI|nr:hypothetical protein B0H63DRAFT_471367 [Podospora didyma]